MSFFFYGLHFMKVNKNESNINWRNGISFQLLKQHASPVQLCVSVCVLDVPFAHFSVSKIHVILLTRCALSRSHIQFWGEQLKRLLPAAPKKLSLSRAIMELSHTHTEHNYIISNDVFRLWYAFKIIYTKVGKWINRLAPHSCLNYWWK